MLEEGLEATFELEEASDERASAELFDEEAVKDADEFVPPQEAKRRAPEIKMTQGIFLID